MKSGLRAMGVLRPDPQASEEPVALETAVIATGARPGDAGARRELFSEETQTVLVFAKGAVIRLSAAVADGQLLFLTNKKSGKEVVTQVVRKRSFRPTSCYVDLEFTEPSPDFWGIEFSKSAPALPSQVVSDSSGDDDVDSIKHAAPPNLQEVERLKKEVSELQSQLKNLRGGKAVPESAAAVPPNAVAIDSATSELLKQPHEESALAQLIAQEAQQEQPHGPKRLVAYPKRSRSSVVKAASKAATIAAFAAVVAAAGIAAYRFGLFDSFIAKPTASRPASTGAAANLNSGTPPTPKIGHPVVAPGKSLAAPQTAPLPSNAQPENPAGKSVSAAADTLPTAPNDMPNQGKQRGGSRGKDLAGAVSAAGTVPASGAVHVRESGNATAAEDNVAPKLVYSVKPVSPPEALRNYVTGNVSVDALIDATGHVKSVTVLSGPQKLRNTAIAEMKQYVYEPARENGRPVSAHVQVSLKYWYEP